MVFTMSDRGVAAIPGGYLVVRAGDLSQLPGGYLKEQWARTRPKHIHRMAMSGTGSPVAEPSRAFAGIPEALAAWAAEDVPHAGATGTKGSSEDATSASASVPVWEIQLPAGRIGRGAVARGLMDVDDAPKLPDVPEPQESPGPQDAVDGAGSHSGLRLRGFDQLRLNSAELANPVAAYLGGPLTHQIGWLTVAPATGSTPNWNGTSVRTLMWSGHATSYANSAKAALLEGMERRVGALQSDSQFIDAPRTRLSGRVLTPDDFPSYPQSFYGHKGGRYDPEERHEWVAGSSLASGERVWIPREFVYYGQQMAHRRWALSTSSGCATGSSLDEAALFGLLELIERDAFVASWYGRIAPFRIDPATVPGLATIMMRAELLGYEVECGLIPSDMGIPVAVASVAGASEVGRAAALGASCHPSARRAIEGALNEAWTYISERIAMAPAAAGRIAQLAEDPTLCVDISDHPLLCVGASREDYRHLCGTGPVSEFEEDGAWGAWAGTPARQLLTKLVEELRAVGIEVFACVQTSATERRSGLETVMVIAPGLLPIDFGWDNQRALCSERLRDLMRRHHGGEVEPRTIPHPFS